MKKKMADKWIAALRSGDYKQGNAWLHNLNDEFCCLGVACKVAGMTPTISTNGRYAYKGDSCVLSTESQSIIGIDSACGNFKLTKKEVKYLEEKYKDVEFDHLLTDLTSLNDAGVSFEDIADIIEKHYRQL